MIELKSREQVAKAIERAKARHPRVTVKKFGEYQVTGSAGNLQVRIDLAGVARRAITNRATEEAKEAIKKGLDGLFGR